MLSWHLFLTSARALLCGSGVGKSQVLALSCSSDAGQPLSWCPALLGLKFERVSVLRHGESA